MKHLRVLFACLVLLAMVLTACTPRVQTPDPTPDVTPDVTPNPKPDTGEVPTTDPYVGVSKSEFYADYAPATSNEDAAYRTAHHFMSGSIAAQDQEPTIATYQPMQGFSLIKNSDMLYSDDGDTYYVLDSYGNIAYEIYKDGAYVTLDEVAAYVFAFGDVPPNYDSNKKADPDDSPWGKYLRVNNSGFSGSTSRYPYEPELPRIQGCGGDLYYYEIDIGTTGTDCDPKYTAREYNNGSSITRGAARIVYVRYTKDRAPVKDFADKYVFYTYNHYNDFQEYLNYAGGWGVMFGNVTGGGTLSSKYDCNPTPYVEVVTAALYQKEAAATLFTYIVVAYVMPGRNYCLSS